MTSITRAARLSPKKRKERNDRIIAAVDAFRKTNDKKHLAEIVELIYPIASDAVSTYPDDIAWDILHTVMADVMTKHNFLRFNPEKGDIDQFMYRCFRNLAVNAYHAMGRHAKYTVSLGALGHDDDKPELPHDGRAVLEVSGGYDDIDIVSPDDHILSIIKTLCVERFCGTPHDYTEPVMLLARECLVSGSSTRSTLLPSRLVKCFKLTCAEAAYVQHLTAIMLRRASVMLGINTVTATELAAMAEVVPDNLFIDLCHDIGWQKAVSLIQVFGGTTIRVPKMDDFCKVVMRCDIYNTMAAVRGKKKRSAAIEVLAKKYRVTPRAVRSVWRKMRSIERRAERIAGGDRA